VSRPGIEEGDPMERRIRVGVVGTGRIAGFVHLPSLRLLPDLVEVTAIASRDPLKAKAFAEQWGVPRVHDGWEALVADPEIDAVVVCPPSDLNGLVAGAAIAAGKHVLCEKPLALTYPAARALAEDADRGTGRVHMVAFTFRFTAALRYLRCLLDEGHFGDVRHWRMSYFNDGQLDPQIPYGWRHQRARGGSGVIADMGSHMIDIARYLLGDIVAVSAASRTYVAERAIPGGGRGRVETPEASAWVAEFANGVIGTFDVSRGVAGRGGTGRPQYQAVEIHGTGGAALYELIHPFQLQVSVGPAMARRQHWATLEVPPDLAVYPGSPRNPRADDPLLGYKYDQGVAFVRAMRSETTDYPTFRDGAAAQAVVDAVDQSAQARRWVDVPRD
jgi:predicted dehydrogenase